MARKCPVCEHPSRAAIEESVESLRSARRTALIFGLSRDQIQRHKAHIVAKSLGPDGKAITPDDVVELKRLAQYEYDTADDSKTRIAALGRLQAAIELERRVHQGSAATAASLTAHPAWELFRTQLLGIIGQCPSCSAAVLEAMPPGDTRSD